MDINKLHDVMFKAGSNNSISKEEHRMLIEAIKKGDISLKVGAARALSRLKDPNDLKYILDILNMNIDSFSLIEAVSMYGNQAIKELIPMLEQSKDKKYLRENILKVFAFVAPNLKDDKISSILVERLNDEFIGVKMACIQGIEKLKLKQAIEPLKLLILNEKDEILLARAKKALDIIEETIN